MHWWQNKNQQSTSCTNYKIIHLIKFVGSRDFCYVNFYYNFFMFSSTLRFEKLSYSHFIFIRSLMEHWNVSLVNFAQNSVLPGWEVEPQLSGCRPMEESILFRF